MPVNTTLQVRRGSGENWNSVNPTLSNGELGLNTDNKLFKIGDGLTTWTSLPYYPGIPLSSGTGIGLSYAKDSNNTVTGISIFNAIRAGSNISLTLSGNDIVIAGSSPTTVSAGTGVGVVQSGDNYQINLDNEHVRDLIGGILLGNSGIGINVDDSSNTITFSVTGILSTQINDFNSAVDARVTAGSISSEEIRDIVATGINGGTGIYIEYDDNGTQLININVTGVSFAGHTHDDRYYTETELSTSGGGGQVHWNNITSTPTGFTPVSHTHPSTQISDFTEAVQDVVGTNAGSTGFLRNGSGIAWNYNDGDDTLSVGVTGIPSSLITDFAAAVSDQVDTTLSAGTGIVLSYNSGTNTLTIDTSGYSLLNHTHVWSEVTDASATVSLSELAYLSGVTAGTASANRAVVLDSNKNINGIGTITTTGNVTVGGDLVVNGTTTTVNSTTVDIGDNIIRVNTSGLTTGGLEVYTGTDYKQLVWNVSNNRWEFTGGDVYTSGNFISNSLQVSSTGLVSNLNADLLDGEHGSYYRNFVNLTGLPDPTITGTLTGDVTGTGTVTLTDLTNGTLSISTVLADNTVTSAKIVDGTIVDADINNSAAIAVTKLASSGITLGSTTVNLGQTSTVIDGLTRISGVSANNPTYIYYAIIDGGTP